MSEEGACLKQIESDEIKKLIDLIYCSKPETIIEADEIDIDNHEKIIKRVNQIIGQE